jgi:hypothetical protein
MVGLGQFKNIALQSPVKFMGKATKKVIAEMQKTHQRGRDLRKATYANSDDLPQRSLCRHISRVSSELLRIGRCEKDIVHQSDLLISHVFNLLGSGFVNVRHGMSCSGLERYKYDNASHVDIDKNGSWLLKRINPSNLDESQRIWKLVDDGYMPIDWQLDFKSGYRWNESTWYLDIKFAHKPGADIKVPWELARMQHLPQLAWAYALSTDGLKSLLFSQAYANEFRNQLLDFIATNPPRFGVNWRCTMDVAIRVANWLISYDLLIAHGAVFDEEFMSVFTRSIYEHGRHIAANLERGSGVLGNHYLADIVGLLFVAAYLPENEEVCGWQAFAIHELIEMVKSQFYIDGSNFEASTSYHCLSTEMVVYATAIVLSLNERKQPAFAFPAWYVERLEKMAEFVMDITKPGGCVPQIGDNDSGRFLKLHWDENCLDHRHLVAAINGLYHRDDYEAFSNGFKLEDELVKGLAKNVKLSPTTERGSACYIDRLKNRHISATSMKRKGSKGSGLSEGLILHSYLDFGLYIYRSKRLYLAIRCGTVGQNGEGGHAHNDQLSFELAIDSVSFIVDSGTYLYTPIPDERNRFRSTASHNVLHIREKEQNEWLEGERGLFQLRDRSKAQVLVSSETEFKGLHYGFGAPCYRSFMIKPDNVLVEDELAVEGEKISSFHLAPGVEVNLSEDSKTVRMSAAGRFLNLKSEGGKWNVKESYISPAYGVKIRSSLVSLTHSNTRIRWAIEVGKHGEKENVQESPQQKRPEKENILA